MKVLQVNFYDIFSTGNIMLNIARVGRLRGHEMYTASKYQKMSVERHRNDKWHYYVGNRVTNTISRYLAWTTDYQDCGCVTSTMRFIRHVEKIKPDIIHLHDVVGWYLNIGILFRYLKKLKIPVVWTFHDCWAFTGRCIYFDAAGCDRWKTGCGNCPQKHYMPGTWWTDRSAWNYAHKKKLFTGIDNLTIVTPSAWLGGLTKESFFKDYPVRIINNGIDLKVFKPTFGNIYDELRKDGKHNLLGVAGTWSARKGLHDILTIAGRIPENYKFIIVGLSPEDVAGYKNIVAIPRTHDMAELAQIYSAADVLVNPTYEDNFPTVNLEALGCGTPIVTYETGGSPESVAPGCGAVVAKGNFDALYDAIILIVEKGRPAFEQRCIEASKRYEMEARFNDYVNLYEELLSNNG